MLPPAFHPSPPLPPHLMAALPLPSRSASGSMRRQPPASSPQPFRVGHVRWSFQKAFSGLCFEVGAGGGGRLEKCEAGSTSQQWAVRGVLGKQLIINKNSSQCIARKQTPLSAFSDVPTVTFDVVASLGWTAGAHVRDLWQHKDLGVTRKVAVSLKGGGDSHMYKLTKA